MTMVVRGESSPDLTRDPTEVLAQAQRAAKALVGVINQKPKKIIMNGEQYIENDDWQTVAEFYGYAVQTQDAVPVEVNGVQGAKAKASLLSMRTGEIVGGAEAYCMRDEEKWNTRPKYEGRGDNRKKVGDEPVPWFQLASMAQTRASSKAMKNRLAWVVALAGYKTTPAEELTGDEGPSDNPDKTTVPVEHYCAVHKTQWFKKGNMKGYAHPISGTKEWCNESEQHVDATASPERTSDHIPTPVMEAAGFPQQEEKEQTPTEALLMTVRASKPALKRDADVRRWLEGPMKVPAGLIDSDPDAVWGMIKEQI
jgi:hypothetical protein